MSDELAGRVAVVTGGAGFIGSELVRLLVAERARVTIVDNLSTGRRENLAGLDPDSARLVEADIRDRRRMAEILVGADVVYHLACLGVRHSIHSPEENFDVNATAALGLLCAARDAGAGRFVHVSSSEVYGTAQAVPMDESHPTMPSTIYGASKLAGEACCRAFHRAHGLPAVIVRPFNAYGPRCHHEGDSGEVIPRFMLRCLAGREMVIFGDGEQTRDFTHVRDIARGIMLAGVSEAAVGETINLGSGEETGINILAVEVARAAKSIGPAARHERPRPGDVRRQIADASKAGALLGFEPTIPLADGLAMLREWYQSLGVPAEVLLEQDEELNWEAAGRGRHG